MVDYILGGETVGITASKDLVEVRTSLGETEVVAVDEREVLDRQSTEYLLHGIGVESFPDGVVDYGELGIAMVYEVLYVVGLEVMKYGDYHRSIGHCAEEGHTPH